MFHTNGFPLHKNVMNVPDLVTLVNKTLRISIRSLMLNAVVNIGTSRGRQGQRNGEIKVSCKSMLDSGVFFFFFFSELLLFLLALV